MADVPAPVLGVCESELHRVGLSAGRNGGPHAVVFGLARVPFLGHMDAILMVDQKAKEECMTQIMCETFFAPTMYFAIQVVLSLCASRHTHGFSFW